MNFLNQERMTLVKLIAERKYPLIVLFIMLVFFFFFNFMFGCCGKKLND